MTANFLEPKDVCDRYGISIHTLYEWTSESFIPHIKLGGKLLFREQDLVRWEESRLTGVANTKLL
jgi:excisionase family DNA binding protein